MDDPNKPQPDKFRDLARQLEVNEDERAFEETVRRVAKPSAEKAIHEDGGGDNGARQEGSRS